jgi:hypothetical protein
MTRNTTFALLLMLLGMAGSQPAGAMTPGAEIPGKPRPTWSIG